MITVDKVSTTFATKLPISDCTIIDIVLIPMKSRTLLDGSLHMDRY